jgi:KDO2-lipid IV(A) lauroyltransferase
VAGELAYLLAPEQRRAVQENLRLLLPDAPRERRRRLARSVFRSVCRYYVELLRLPSWPVQALHARVTIDGYDNLLDALAEGHGAIICGIHQGPAEIVLQAFAGRGQTYTAMVERVRPPQLAALLQRTREAYGNRFVYPNLAGTRALLRTLRAGGLVAVLIDRDVLGNGIPATFSGREIRVPAGQIELATATGAPIVCASPAWMPDGTYHVTILPPFRTTLAPRVRDPALRRADAERLLAQFEPFLRARPGQWLVLQRFWT